MLHLRFNSMIDGEGLKFGCHDLISKPIAMDGRLLIPLPLLISGRRTREVCYPSCWIKIVKCFNQILSFSRSKEPWTVGRWSFPSWTLFRRVGSSWRSWIRFRHPICKILKEEINLTFKSDDWWQTENCSCLPRSTLKWVTSRKTRLLTGDTGKFTSTTTSNI